MDKSKSLKFAAIFIAICALTVGPIHILGGNLIMGIVLILMVGAIDAAYFMMRDSGREQFLSYLMVLGAIATIAVTQTISGDISFTVQMLMALVSLSLLFFDLKLILLSTVLASFMFLVQVAVMSIQLGGLCLSILRVAESVAAIAITGVLVYKGAGYGLHYLNEAGDRQQESDRILKDLDQKNDQSQKMLGRQQDLMEQIGTVAGQLTATSQALSAQSDNLAMGSGSQAEAVNRLNESIDSVSDMIVKTDEQAQQVRTALEAMEKEIIEGNQSMEHMVSAVGDINANMQDIEKIIKSINDIAFQTNLLALNASVEAARAGVAGKGFTVVAGEVRNLAQRSADAVKETIRVLDNCRKAVSQGNRVADDTAAMLTEIKSHAGDVTQIAFKISDMTASQKEELQKVSAEVDLVTNEIQKTADAASENALAVRELSEHAGLLESLSR